MMTKEQTSVIPEELYNLTQLAEVTLAAGRLSTTNVTEIKDYIENNKYLTLCYEKAKQNSFSIPHIQYVPHWSHYQPLDLNDAQKFYKQYQELCPLSSAKYDMNNYKAHNFQGTINAMTAIESIERPLQCTRDTIQNESGESLCNPALGTSCSSSDDDCNYYSHKVFDRKKLRRFTMLDNSSRYDEHSCSSVPSCSGDEQQLVKTISSTLESANKFHAPDSNESNMSSTEDDHICTECGKKYSTSSNLARHRQTHRSIMDKKARRCPYCEKVYVSMPAFSMHVRTHNQGCECPFCGKCFSRPWLLQGHIRTHTGEKPFKCNICDKAFADKSNLRAHIQTHSNVKPHTCPRCNKAFALKSYLYKHEESSCMRNTHRDDRKLRQLARAAASG